MEQSNWPTSQDPSELSALEKLCVILPSSSVRIPPRPQRHRADTAALGWSLRTGIACIRTATSYILFTVTVP